MVEIPAARGLWRFIRRFEARVLIGVIVATGALFSFLEIGDDMAEGDTLALDRQFMLLLRAPGEPNDPIGSRTVEEAVRDVTALGGTTVVALVTLVGILAFVFHKKHKHALVLSAGVLLAWASTDLAKILYDRPRPDLVPHGAYVYSGSFPSGHSALAAATYLILAMLVASLEPKRRTKALAYGLACALLVAVGVSRVYLGVHWPSDVLAGWCLGGIWALAAWIALRMMHAPTRG